MFFIEVKREHWPRFRFHSCSRIFPALTARLLLNGFWTLHPTPHPAWVGLSAGCQAGCLWPAMWIDMLFKNGSVWIIQSVILVSAFSADVWLSRKHSPMIPSPQLSPQKRMRCSAAAWSFPQKNEVWVFTVTPSHNVCKEKKHLPREGDFFYETSSSEMLYRATKMI